MMKVACVTYTERLRINIVRFYSANISNSVVNRRPSSRHYAQCSYTQHFLGTAVKPSRKELNLSLGLHVGFFQAKKQTYQQYWLHWKQWMCTVRKYFHRWFYFYTCKKSFSIYSFDKVWDVSTIFGFCEQNPNQGSKYRYSKLPWQRPEFKIDKDALTNIKFPMSYVDHKSLRF